MYWNFSSVLFSSLYSLDLFPFFSRYIPNTSHIYMVPSIVCSFVCIYLNILNYYMWDAITNNIQWDKVKNYDALINEIRTNKISFSL